MSFFRLDEAQKRIGGFDLLVDGDPVKLHFQGFSETDAEAFVSRLNVHIGKLSNLV